MRTELRLQLLALAHDLESAGGDSPDDAEWQAGKPGAVAIRAALAEVDALTEHDRLASALCNQHAATIDAQAAELVSLQAEVELLRRTLACTRRCHEGGCHCDACKAVTEWSAKYGIKGA